MAPNIAGRSLEVSWGVTRGQRVVASTKIAVACGGFNKKLPRRVVAFTKNCRGVWWLSQKKGENRSVSKMIDHVETINSVQKSSKSELSSGTFGHFKVSYET